MSWSNKTLRRYGSERELYTAGRILVHGMTSYMLSVDMNACDAKHSFMIDVLIYDVAGHVGAAVSTIIMLGAYVYECIISIDHFINLLQSTCIW